MFYVQLSRLSLRNSTLSRCIKPCSSIISRHFAASPSFQYQDIFQQNKVEIQYKKLTDKHVSTINVEGKEVLKVEPEALTMLVNKHKTSWERN